VYVDYHVVHNKVQSCTLRIDEGFSNLVCIWKWEPDSEEDGEDVLKTGKADVLGVLRIHRADSVRELQSNQEKALTQ